MKTPILVSAFVSLACLLAGGAHAAPPPAPEASRVTPDMIQTGSDIPDDWKQPHENFDYTKREVMIPMRDGVKLHTVILTPKGAKDLPIVL
ncbi:MAG: glutaryl-7-ACA acylase, partial [Rhodanobacteraceae bacterium]